MSLHPRTLGFDDGMHQRGDATTPLVGVMARGAQEMEAVVVGEAAVDGWDATEKILVLARRLPGAGPDVILVDGVAMGGLNVVDAAELARDAKRPVICVTRRRPDRPALERAIRKLADPERRLAKLPVGNAVSVDVDGVTLFANGFDDTGAALDAKSIVLWLRPAMASARLPEPLRIAHLIATALSRGVSGTPA